MNEIELLEFITDDGRNPFREWLHGLRDAHTRARIRVRLNRLRLGNLGDCSPVGEGVSELRMSFGPGFRVYFGQQGNRLIILLCGGDKKSQSRDIRIAQNYWELFKSRRP